MGFIEFLAWITDNVGFICCIFLFVFSLICLSFHEQTPEIKFTIHLMDDNKLELFCRRNLRGKTCLTSKTLEFWRQWVQSIYLRDIARTLANIYNEDFFKNSSQLLAINYCCKPSLFGGLHYASVCCRLNVRLRKFTNFGESSITQIF